MLPGLALVFFPNPHRIGPRNVNGLHIMGIADIA